MKRILGWMIIVFAGILTTVVSACGQLPTPSPNISPTNTLEPTRQAASTPTKTSMIFPTHTLSPCIVRASFGDPAQSPYILPFNVGKSYRVTQSYCEPDGGHANQLAYDFRMPVGFDVIAARSGIVLGFIDRYPDGIDGPVIEHNYILIQHDDGSVAFYAHIEQDSIQLRVGEEVEQGQAIAKSGNSGMTGGLPHLHFGVYQFYPLQEGYDVAVSFRNAEGLLDSRGGLIKELTYKALPY